jgi:hypothetical protein
MSKLAGVVRLLKTEQDRLTKELHGITAALAAFGQAYVKGTGARKLSVSARARIAAAQKTRWAKYRQGAAASSQSKAVPTREKRTLSAAARRKIAAAQRARWAKVKATKKTA